MRKVVKGALIAAAAAFLASAGCEVIVGDALPAYTCQIGDPTACPPGQSCTNAGVCAAPCPATPCPADLVCDTANQTCVAPVGPDGGLPDQTTPGDAVTHPDSALDQKSDTTPPGDSPNKGDIGEPCGTPPMCNPGLLCADSSFLTAPVTNIIGAICTKTCCSSEECPTNFACYAPGTGGNYCVPSSALPREIAPAAGAPGGTTCDAGGQCRSGICDDPNEAGVKRCTDACCKEGACTGGGVCGLSSVEGHITVACTQAEGTAAAESSCTTKDCINGLCGDDFYCHARCCGSADCTGTDNVCRYFALQGATVKEYVPVCVSDITGTAKVGDPCPGGTDSECEVGFCEISTKTCTDVCCTDDDCKNYPGYTACRPDPNPNVHYLICSKP